MHLTLLIKTVIQNSGQFLVLAITQIVDFHKTGLRIYGYANIISKDSVDTGPAFYTFRDSVYTHTILESALANFSFKIKSK